MDNTNSEPLKADICDLIGDSNGVEISNRNSSSSSAAACGSSRSSSSAHRTATEHTREFFLQEQLHVLTPVWESFKSVANEHLETVLKACRSEKEAALKAQQQEFAGL
jgi:hypothetical protein